MTLLIESKLILNYSANDLAISHSLMAPCNAKIQPLTSHPRALVKEGYFGDGIAFIPFGYKFYSPVSGKINYLPATCDKIILQSKQGLRLHIEFGINTASLMSSGFKPFYKTGDNIEKGQLLFEFDQAYIEKKLPSLLSFLTILNANQLKAIYPMHHQVRAIEDACLYFQLPDKQ